jgi:hypothetical protein
MFLSSTSTFNLVHGTVATVSAPYLNGDQDLVDVEVCGCWMISMFRTPDPIEGLATAGAYTVVLDPAGTATGQVHLRLIDVHDQKGTIAVGGPAVTATIGQPGAVASFTFTGTAGQKVSVVATGSTLPDQCGVIQLRDAAKAVLESGCLITNKGGIATATLPASAVYTVSVDPAALATGAISLAVTAL